MFIQSVSNVYSNYNKQLNQMSFAAKQRGVACNLQWAQIDSAALSKKKRVDINDDALCEEIIKNERKGNGYRFSPMEQLLLTRDIKKFHSSSYKKDTLSALLNIKSPNGKQLSFDDIIAFFYVMDGSTLPQKDTVIQLIKNEAANEQLDKLNEKIFVRFENCPEMLKELTKINNLFDGLSSNERCDLMNATFDVVEASNYEYHSFAKDIAKVIKNDDTGSVRKILIAAADKLTTDVNNDCKAANKKKFKYLLSILTPETIDVVKLSFETINNRSEEKSYINRFLEHRNIA